MLYLVLGISVVAIIGYALYRSKKNSAKNESSDFKDSAVFFDKYYENNKDHDATENVKIELALDPKVSEPKIEESTKKPAKKKTKTVKKDVAVAELLPEVTVVTTPKKKLVKKQKAKKIVG